MHRIVIVGAGVSGLALAYRLQLCLPDADIILLEQADRPGGTTWTLRADGYQLEVGPNGFLDNKPTTIALCRDLGLAERLVAASATSARKRYLLLEGRLRSLPVGFRTFLTSDLLSWRGKLALVGERFRRQGGGQDESIAGFIRRRTSREVADLLGDAFVTGIFGGDAELLSMQASFPRLVTLEQEHGSVLKGLMRTAKQRRAEAKARGQPYQRGSKLWSLRDGLRLMVEALGQQLRRPPLLGVQVRRLSRHNGSWLVAADGQDAWSADAVVLSCPAYQQAALVADLDAELADRIGTIPYNRVAVVGLGFRRADVPGSYDGFGFIAPQRTRRDLLGVQWCSAIFPQRAPDGAVLMRALCGGWHRADVVGWDDGRLLAAVRAELVPAMGITAAPIFQRIIRWDRAIPQYPIGHLQRLAQIKERLGRFPGLFLAGNAYHGVSLNDCTEQAGLVAHQVRQFLTERQDGTPRP